jgi:hypothetical protein
VDQYGTVLCQSLADDDQGVYPIGLKRDIPYHAT